MKTTLSEPDRVRRNTCPAVNQRIERRLQRSLDRHAQLPREDLGRRIERLDREWDIERTLEVHAAAIGLGGVVAAITVHRRWFALPVAVLGFLLLHGIEGWCPPVPVFRRLGVRTRREIERERYALKALRGDFAGVGPHDADAARRAVGY